MNRLKLPRDPLATISAPARWVSFPFPLERILPTAPEFGPRNQDAELGEVASIQRQLLGRLLGNHVAQLGALRVEQRRSASDGHLLLDLTDAQRKILFSDLLHLQRKTLAHCRLKPLGAHGDGVGSRFEKGRDIVAGGICNHGDVTPVVSFAISTEALGMAAPLGSVTWPEMVALALI